MIPCEAHTFEDRQRLTYDADPSPHRNVWFAYWVCSVSDLDQFLNGQLPRNYDFEIGDPAAWVDVMTFQYDREDQSCDSGERDDVSVSGEREINGLRLLAPVQHYPFILQSAMSAAIGIAGVPQVCLHESWGEDEPREFRRAFLAWSCPAITPAKAPEHSFDARLRRLLSLDPASPKVMMVIQGYGAPLGEYRTEAHRKKAWGDFGFAVNSRTPSMLELHPGAATGTPPIPPSVNDLLPLNLGPEPKFIDPHEYLFINLAVPLEAGSLTAFLMYWAAVGQRSGEIPEHLRIEAMAHPWATQRALETLRRYIEAGLVTVGLRRSFYHEAAQAASATSPTAIPSSVSEMSGDISKDLGAIAESIKEYASSGSRKALSHWGVSLTDRGWAFRASLEPQLDQIIAQTWESWGWGTVLPYDPFG
jgi:hypothetical protein